MVIEVNDIAILEYNLRGYEGSFFNLHINKEIFCLINDKIVDSIKVGETYILDYVYETFIKSSEDDDEYTENITHHLPNILAVNKIDYIKFLK